MNTTTRESEGDTVETAVIVWAHAILERGLGRAQRLICDGVNIITHASLFENYSSSVKIISEESPDTDWTGLVAYAAAVVALLAIGRWMENSGLEAEEEECEAVSQCCVYV